MSVHCFWGADSAKTTGPDGRPASSCGTMPRYSRYVRLVRETGVLLGQPDLAHKLRFALYESLHHFSLAVEEYVSIFARDGATGFRPYGATRQDDAGGIPGEKPNDEWRTLGSNWLGKHLLSCEVRPVSSEADTGDDDDVRSVCEAVQPS